MLLTGKEAIAHLIKYIESGAEIDYREVIIYPFTVRFKCDETAVGIIHRCDRCFFYYRDEKHLIRQLSEMKGGDLVIKAEYFLVKVGGQ